MGHIAWSQFSWEAFATLATGMMAVAAAVVVGRRQLLLAEKQTQILDRQAQFDELTLRHALFDRRMGVYDATREYLVQVMREAAPPGPGTTQVFRDSVGIARFLFNADAYGRIEEIARQALRFESIHHQSRVFFETEGHYGEGLPEQEEQLLLGLVKMLESLPEMFGEEIRLS